MPYVHPEKGERLTAEYPYHWIDSAESQYKHLATNVTHAHWQALRAAKTAVSAIPEKEQEVVKQKLFHDNAKLFYGF